MAGRVSVVLLLSLFATGAVATTVPDAGSVASPAPTPRASAAASGFVYATGFFDDNNDCTAYLARIDLSTGQVDQKVALLGAWSQPVVCEGFRSTFDMKSSQYLLGFYYETSFDGVILITVDATTGDVVGNATIVVDNWASLEVDQSSSNLYVQLDELCSVDRYSGLATQVASTKESEVNYLGPSAFDSTTGTFFLGAYHPWFPPSDGFVIETAVVGTGEVTVSPLVANASLVDILGLEYDENTGTLYGLYIWDYNGVWLVDIDWRNGGFKSLAYYRIDPDGILQGKQTTYDPDAGVLYLVAQSGTGTLLYGFNVNTGVMVQPVKLGSGRYFALSFVPNSAV